MLPIVFVLVAPFAFTEAFIARNVPTFGEQLRRVQEGTASSAPFGNYPRGYWITWAVQYFVVTPIVTAALLRVLLGAFLGEDWAASDAVRAAWRLVRQLVWTFTLSTLATFGPQILASAVVAQGTDSNDLVVAVGASLTIVGFVCLFIFGVRLFFTGPAVVVEGERGAAALRRSWRLSHGSFWKIAGNQLVLSLLAGIVIGLISLVPQEIAHANDGAWWLLAGLGVTVAAGIVTPFLTAANTMLYLHCRVRKEGLTLEQLEQQIGASDPGGWHVLPAPPNS